MSADSAEGFAQANLAFPADKGMHMKDDLLLLIAGLGALCVVLALQGYSVSSVMDQNAERAVVHQARFEIADSAWRTLFSRPWTY